MIHFRILDDRKYPQLVFYRPVSRLILISSLFDSHQRLSAVTTDSNALYTMSQVTDRRSTNGLHDSLHQWLTLKIPNGKFYRYAAGCTVIG
jgi:hypothetical protein